ncbi:MAG TPA: hypothetical protein VGG71_05500 [Chitinophagaceae bacterium]|jgi:hypothetical protein
MKQLDTVKKHLKPGEVYRRADLQNWTTAVDRNLQQLVGEGTLEKLSGGLYYVPQTSVFGKTPANEHELVSAFLKDNRFVLTSPSDYNALGVGTTQLYNERRVYNHKRHGTYKLGNRTFRFVRKPYVPTKLTKEFLLVDLVNNLKHLEENQESVLENVKAKAREMDPKRLKKLVQEFGTVGTKKKFAELLNE